MDFSFENETSIPKTNQNKIFSKEDCIYKREDNDEKNIAFEEEKLTKLSDGISDIDLSN